MEQHDKKPDAPKGDTKAASAPDAKPGDPKTERKPDAAPAKADAPKTDANADAMADAVKATEAPAAKPDPAKSQELPAIKPPDPGAEPWPDATPQPMKPVDPPARARTETVGMPTGSEFGKPPEMPKQSAPPVLALGTVENPTHMPGPREIPGGDANDPAPAPGRVPPGDSRSLRRGDEFALVYRVATYVISRFGSLGKRGQWRVVEYPTSTSASHGYAKECSRFVSEGFSDYRD
ncbi:MAG: hypothetical protein JWO36_2422 [Myxococcales bacterium]|nr:hypothetical protein [Myxococcales bacterium]